jgi:hypothetical protein
LSTTTPIVGLVYRNFRAYGPDMYSHVGLGINAFHTAKVLRAHGIQAYGGAYGPVPATKCE